jgi:hypothetical protein
MYSDQSGNFIYPTLLQKSEKEMGSLQKKGQK